MKKEKWPATGVTVKFFEVEPSGDIFFLLNESGEICLVTWNKVDFCAVKKKKKPEFRSSVTGTLIVERTTVI